MENSLKTLYSISVNHKIAVLGDMNELGEISELEHKKIGEICDPSQLELLITVGKMSKKYLAPIAEKHGCKVISFDTALEAGKFLKNSDIKDATILFKGSQGGIYLEDAVKELLLDPSDAEKLVRQSQSWKQIKAKFYDSFSQSQK